MSKETMKLALEALELNNAEWKSLADSGDAGFWHAEDQAHYQQTNNAITALREALAEQPASRIVDCHATGVCVQSGLRAEQPAQQEPVAWWDKKLGVFDEKHFDHLQPLYTSPPAQRKPLTDEQIIAIGKELGLKCRLGGNPNIDFDYARAIEAAHGIKENT